jgi:CRP-like cAMP-binding protein
MPGRFKIEKFRFDGDSILTGLPETDIHFLESRMTDRRYRKGQRIFLEGTYPSGVFYLKKGKIKKYKADWDGREQIFYICNEGELFGYPTLLSGEPYTHSTAAVEESLVSIIARNDFLKIVKDSPELSRHLLRTLSHEFGVLVNSLALFAHRTVRERLALSLLILAEKYRVNGDAKKPAAINLSREDLANMVGAAVETLVRLLHDLKEEKVIETEGRKIRILDTKKLVKLANFY